MSITDSQLNEIDAIFADFTWIDFKRPVWEAVKTRLQSAETDAERAWAWVWTFDEWTGHKASSALPPNLRDEFRRDLTAHENYGEAHQ